MAKLKIDNKDVVLSSGKGCREPGGSENWPVFKPSTTEKPHACGWTLSGASPYNKYCEGQIGSSQVYRDNYEATFGKRCIKCRQKECRCE